MINPKYVGMSRLNMDLKIMPRSHKGHRYILCIIDEVTNFLVTVPIFQAKSEEVGEALLEHVNKILHTRIYNNGSRQCIHVLIDDLSLL